MIVAAVVLYLSASVAIASALGHRLQQLSDARARLATYRERANRTP